MQSRVRTLLLALSMAVLALILPSCGGGSDSGTTPTTTPPGPQRNTLPTITFTGLDRGEAQAINLSISPTAGVAEIVADWTFATNDIDIFVTNSGCVTSLYNTLFFQTGGCTSLARGTSTSKPERLTTGTLSPGDYKVYVGSSGISRTGESGTVSITIVR